MSNFKPIDAKRDDFRKYLELTGVLEELSKIFRKLLILHSAERPENAIEFIVENLGYSLHQKDLIETLKQELDDSKNETAQLKNEIAQLKNVIELLRSSKNTELVSSDESNDQINDECDEKPSSTTEIISVTEVENQMKNLEIDKNDADIDCDLDGLQKNLDDDISSVPVQEHISSLPIEEDVNAGPVVEEDLQNITTTEAEPQKENLVAEEVK